MPARSRLSSAARGWDLNSRRRVTDGDRAARTPATPSGSPPVASQLPQLCSAKPGELPYDRCSKRPPLSRRPCSGVAALAHFRRSARSSIPTPALAAAAPLQHRSSPVVRASSVLTISRTPPRALFLRRSHFLSPHQYPPRSSFRHTPVSAYRVRSGRVVRVGGGHSWGGWSRYRLAVSSARA
jgi:hypothetical protein